MVRTAASTRIVAKPVGGVSMQPLRTSWSWATVVMVGTWWVDETTPNQPTRGVGTKVKEYTWKGCSFAPPPPSLLGGLGHVAVGWERKAIDPSPGRGRGHPPGGIFCNPLPPTPSTVHATPSGGEGRGHLDGRAKIPSLPIGNTGENTTVTSVPSSILSKPTIHSKNEDVENHP